MSLIIDGQTYQEIPPLSVARELLIQEDGFCYPEVGRRIWTDDLPGRDVFENNAPGAVLVDSGFSEHEYMETLFISGVMRVRVWSGDSNLSSLARVWFGIKKQLLKSSGAELQNAKENWVARWCWARMLANPVRIRKHPETGWPELNALVEYTVQGLQGES